MSIFPIPQNMLDSADRGLTNDRLVESMRTLVDKFPDGFEYWAKQHQHTDPNSDKHS